MVPHVLRRVHEVLQLFFLDDETQKPWPKSNGYETILNVQSEDTPCLRLVSQLSASKVRAQRNVYESENL